MDSPADFDRTQALKAAGFAEAVRFKKLGMTSYSGIRIEEILVTFPDEIFMTFPGKVF